MKDIINVFPTADEIKNMDFSLFLFEKELKDLFYLIARQKATGKNYLTVEYLSEDAKEFLIEKKYDIDALTILW